ncbi:hypothetical protein D3C84_430930 [compost metagenome]
MNKTCNQGPRHDSTRPPGQRQQHGGGLSRSERYSFPDAEDEIPTQQKPAQDTPGKSSLPETNDVKDSRSDAVTSGEPVREERQKP